MTISGVIEGFFTSGGDIIILEDALVKGDMSGPDIRVAGKVEGRISASGKLVISSVGQVVGDIAVRALLIEDGGTLQGQCRMGDGSTSGSNGASVPAPATARS